MNSFVKTTICALYTLAFIVTGNAIADEGYGKQKVVYHINYDNPKAQAGALRDKQLDNHASCR